MEDTTLSVIGIMIAAIIMFIVPLILIADRSDDISQLVAQTATAEFVDEVVKSGKITNDSYQRFVYSLQSSGNTYDIDMEVKILDENPAKAVTTSIETFGQIGYNSYYSIFTSQIEDKVRISSEDVTNNLTGKLILKQGDEIYVTVKNNSPTLSQTLKSFYYNATEGGLHIIAATSSGTIAINGAT